MPLNTWTASCAFASKISRKGRKGLAKAAKLEGITLCDLGVSFAAFAGNNQRALYFAKIWKFILNCASNDNSKS